MCGAISAWSMQRCMIFASLVLVCFTLQLAPPPPPPTSLHCTGGHTDGAWGLGCDREQSKQVNSSRIKVLQARENSLANIVKEAASSLGTISKGGNYKNLLADLLVQVRAARLPSSSFPLTVPQIGLSGTSWLTCLCRCGPPSLLRFPLILFCRQGFLEPLALTCLCGWAPPSLLLFLPSNSR
jgi:ATP synthase (E/31 kDa) subunit